MVQIKKYGGLQHAATNGRQALKAVLPVNGCYFNIHTPKTEAGKRKVPMLDFVRKAFLEEKQRQDAEGTESLAEVDGYDDFIFVNRFGMLQHQSTLNKVNIPG